MRIASRQIGRVLRHAFIAAGEPCRPIGDEAAQDAARSRALEMSYIGELRITTSDASCVGIIEAFHTGEEP